MYIQKPKLSSKLNSETKRCLICQIIAFRTS